MHRKELPYEFMEMAKEAVEHAGGDRPREADLPQALVYATLAVAAALLNLTEEVRDLDCHTEAIARAVEEYNCYKR